MTVQPRAASGAGIAPASGAPLVQRTGSSVGVQGFWQSVADDGGDDGDGVQIRNAGSAKQPDVLASVSARTPVGA